MDLQAGIGRVRKISDDTKGKATKSVDWYFDFLSPFTYLQSRPLDGQIGDAQDVDSGRMQGLGQEHGPELAGPDEGDADWHVFFDPCQEHPVEVHGVCQ